MPHHPSTRTDHTPHHHTLRKLAVQLYSVRDHLADDRRATLRRLADIGFGAVEVHRPTNDPDGLRRLLDEHRLSVCAAHGSSLVRGADPAEVFHAVHTLGAERVIVASGIPKDQFTTADGLKQAAETLNNLAEQAIKNGLKLGYHNHDFELISMVNDRHALDILADLLEPDVFLEVDTYWAAVGGADVPALLRRHGGRVHLLHLKDGPGVRGEPNVALGSGTVDVQAFLAAAPEAWRVIEFDHCETDVIAAIEASHSYVASLEP